MAKLITCAAQDCEELFDKKIHNQRYHSDECCRIETNRKMMKKYYDQKDRKQGKVRICQTCGITKLSRYNESVICSSCEKEKQVKVNNEVHQMLDIVQFV